MNIIEKAADRLQRMEADRNVSDLSAVLHDRAASLGGQQASPRTADMDRPPSIGELPQVLVRRAEQGGALAYRVELDMEALAAAGMLAEGRSPVQLAEEYRRIRQRLLLSTVRDVTERQDRGNLIMVTSALPNEGKTFTAINLALSIAMGREKHVLLVDTDIRKPDIGQRLDVATARGLTDLLAQDDVKLTDVLISTNIAELTLLTAGQRRSNAAELLAGEKMRRLGDELATQYHDAVVLFDAPPLLVSSDAIALAEVVGQVIVVVAADETSEGALKEALEFLGPEKVVNLILNKGRQPLASGYYGYLTG